nr:serine hydrolase domain-containing protein [Allomuricauda sp.]
MKRHYIVMFCITLFVSCNARQKSDEKNQISPQLEDFLANMATNDSLHGAVLIGKNDEILFHEAYGHIDLESTQKHTTESQIGMASMGKMFTAIAIFQLRSKGELQLDDLISKHVDDLENKVLKDSVQIKHLLSHTSGLTSYWDELEDADSQSINQSYIYDLVKNDSISGSVGKKMMYSNSGYIILGKIIEEITGLAYKEYITQNILNPLQMENTHVFLSDGGGQTTTDNLWKFANGIKNGQILEKEDLNVMTKKNPLGNYGYGYMVKHINGVKVYGHTGGYWEENTKLGVASGLDIFDNGYTVIILTNRNPSEGGKIIRDYLLESLSVKDTVSTH